jgi:hypothetical protein
VHLARVFAHGPEKRFSVFSIRSCDFQVQAHFVCLHRRHDPDFAKKHHAQTEERPAAIRRLGDDGQGARRAGSKAQELLPATIGRMKPSGTSRPWQDRRTLIS